MHPTDSVDPLSGQDKNSPTIAQLGTRLDRAEAANRETFAAWKASRDRFDSYAETADLFAAHEATRAELRAATSAYRAGVRGRVVARGHKDNRRIAGGTRNFDTAWSRLTVAESDARARITGDMDECGRPTPKAETTRELIDAHAKLEGVMIDWDTWQLRNRTTGHDARLLQAHGILS